MMIRFGCASLWSRRPSFEGRALRAVRAGLALLAAAVPMLPFAAVTTTVVDLPTRNVTERILYVTPGAPNATLVVLPGNDGVFGIANDGTMNSFTTVCSPIARNLAALAARGYALVLVDPPTDVGAPYPLYQLSSMQVQDGLEIVRYAQRQANVPVWLVGGELSMQSVGNLAVNLPADLPLGVVFSPANSLRDVDASQIRRPVLLVDHNSDSQIYSPENAAQLFEHLTGAPAKRQVVLSGGGGSPCGTHWYQGIDAEFVAAIGDFIDTYTPTLVVAPPPTAVAIEFYNASLDHYFLTHIDTEIAMLDAGVMLKGWARTGESFAVYPAVQANSSPVCRFYIPPDKGNSHFYGRGTAECNATGAANPTFINEDPQFFHVVLPALGVCPAGTRNVYRTFSNRIDANHRYMVDPAIRDLMVTKGWLAEGDGPDLVVMCSPV